jgi:acylphosphatase
MPAKRVHVLYSGRVQGVGFRFTAEAIARKLQIGGWVSNLRDGKVEIVAEGEEPVLKNFLTQIAEEMSHYIINADVSWERPTGEFKDFGMR